MMKIRNTLVIAGLISSVALSGCSFRTRAEIAREKQEKEMQESLQQNVLQSAKQMEALQAEIGRLQGKLEEMDHNRAKENSTVREGTEKQVSELRARMEEQQKAQNNAQQALFDEIKRLREENAQMAETLSKKPAGGGSGSGQKSGSAKSGKPAYDAGLAAYKTKNYEEAAEGFRGYLEALPNGKFALSARYYLGDCLYAAKDYTNAIVEFGAVQEKSPSSNWGRKSVLRIAESFSALGKKKDAKTFAQLLVDSAPDSAEAKKAKKFLK